MVALCSHDLYILILRLESTLETLSWCRHEAVAQLHIDNNNSCPVLTTNLNLECIADFELKV